MDSCRHTWPVRLACISALKDSTAMPEPILVWKDVRPFVALMTLVISVRSTCGHIALRLRGS